MDKQKELTKCSEDISVFLSNTIRITGTTYFPSPNSPTKTQQLVHTEWLPSSQTTVINLRRNGWKKE